VREAAGADRRPFSEQSIVQHRAMFDRFHRYLVARGATLASFGADVLDGFWFDGDAAHYSPATRMRYLKLIDRLCRHLVAVGVRDANPPVTSFLVSTGPSTTPMSCSCLKTSTGPYRSSYGHGRTTMRPRCRNGRSLRCSSAPVPRPAKAAPRAWDLNLQASPPYLHARRGRRRYPAPSIWNPLRWQL
jgi:hypothetical protein